MAPLRPLLSVVKMCLFRSIGTTTKLSSLRRFTTQLRRLIRFCWSLPTKQMRQSLFIGMTIQGIFERIPRFNPTSMPGKTRTQLIHGAPHAVPVYNYSLVMKESLYQLRTTTKQQSSSVSKKPTRGHRLTIVQITMMTLSIQYQGKLKQPSSMEIGFRRILNHRLSN